MMLPTHAIVGLAIATPLLVLAPDHAAVALVGGLVGGILPDLDLYSGHRRTLHYPSGYALAVVPAAGFAAILQTPLLIALTFVLMGAAVHCRMDRYGGGLELRPWEATSERGVYDHVRGRWRSPKRWIQYDGAPSDAGLMVLVGAPLFVVLDGPFRWIVAAALVTGATYALLRRRLAKLAPVVFGNVPESIAAHVPDRYRQ